MLNIAVKIRPIAWVCSLFLSMSALADSPKQINISAGDLAVALESLSKQADVELVFRPEQVKGLQTRGVNGLLSLQDAVKKLLEGTRLQLRTDGTTGAMMIGVASSAPHAQLDSKSRVNLAQIDPGDGATAGIQGSPEGSQAQGELEEVVVTATKRPISIQKLPQAVTAITSQRLDELNALSFADYFRDVPGLMLNTDSDRRLDFSIRGINDFNTFVPQTTATVGQYLDEIPTTSVGVQTDIRLVDVDHIEVLRGPQGTYYGEGSLGGTIRTITKKPDLGRFSASAEGRVSSTRHGGTNDQESLMLNLPLVDGKLAARANVFNADDSGYIDIVKVSDPRLGPIVGSFKDHANRGRAQGGRLMTLFKPRDSLTILAEAVHTDTHKDGVGGYDPTFGDLIASVVCNPPAPPPPPGQPGPPPAPPSCYDSNLEQVASLYNLTVNGDLGWASLVSASSWASTRYGLDYIPGGAGQATPDDIAEISGAFTQELRLVSSQNSASRWDYVLGAFYNRKYTTQTGLLQTLAGPEPINSVIQEKALFGDLGYRFNTHLSARVGLRAEDLHQYQGVLFADVVSPPGAPLQIGPVTLRETNSDYNPVTGRAVLSYGFNDEALIYASASSGFRRGGANPPVTSNIIRPASFAPDKTRNYEMGWKLAFPARKATLNGAFYHIDWSDMQTVGLGCRDAQCLQAIPFYVNAGDAKVDGFELEAGMEIVKGLSVRSAVSLIDARLAEDYVASRNPLVLHGKKGDRIPWVASVSGSLSLNYRRPLGVSGLYGFGILNSQYQGERRSDFNAQLDSVPPLPPSFTIMRAYWVEGAQLGIENDKWRATLYVDNILNERAPLFKQPTTVPGHFLETPNQPLTVGVFLRRNFE